VGRVIIGAVPSSCNRGGVYIGVLPFSHIPHNKVTTYEWSSEDEHAIIAFSTATWRG
jgi:hypothetical protein